MGKLLLLFILLNSQSLYSQNVVPNHSFESSKIPYNEFYSWIVYRSSYAFNYIDSLSNSWQSLYSNSFAFNRLYPERNVDKMVLDSTRNSPFFSVCNDKVPFHKNAFGLLYPSYRSLDTSKFTPIFWVQNTGNPSDSDIYWGLNPVIFNKLSASLTKDTTYVVSYRLLSGSGIGRNKDNYNVMNNFGIHFTTNNICNTSVRPHDRQTFKIANINPFLQDTILDSSLNWRLIKREFKSEDNYQFIHFGQFLDKRKNKIKISKTFFKDYGYYGGGSFTVGFAFFLDDIRLLPKWQYLDVSPDSAVCEGDSLNLKVINGAGPYIWTESNQPDIILSTQNTFKIKVADTNIKYQVMSPYDTALIAIYVTKNMIIHDTTIYKTCDNKPLKISTPNIYLWYDDTKDTTKLINNSGNFWYLTKTNQSCILNRTQLDIKIGSNKYDTVKQTSCDSFTYKNTTFKKSGHYIFPYKTIHGCDSIHTLALTINKSYFQGSKIASCTSYQWLDSLYTSSGKYQRKMKSIHQCDSIFELSLSIGLNKQLKLENGIHYSSQQDSVSYQWYRCNPWRRIVNETKKTFTTKTRGSYAVVLDNGKGCRDTSDCIELYSSVIVTPTQAGVSMWSVYPNPFNDELIIDLLRDFKEVNVKIYDLAGRMVQSEMVKNASKLNIQNTKLTRGIYYMQIETESQNQFFNIRKE